MAATMTPGALDATAGSGPGVMIEARGIAKAFGATQALSDVDLVVPTGTVEGLLGPNGAGKTTLVRILATLLVPDAGTARIGGVDVAADPNTVRSIIGLAGQFAAVDEMLTGRENLVMVGRLYRLGSRLAKERAGESLERLGLVEAADRPVRTYSGGMRRRLDLGASLVGRPRVLLLDEPTTGLDPRTRDDLWDFIRDLVADGTTVLLTTQYLEEADALADHIVIVDNGQVIATGTSAELKTRLGSDLLEVQVPAAQLSQALTLLHGIGSAAPTVDTERSRLTIPVADPVMALMETVRALDAAALTPADLGVRRPSLDDVFLTLTSGNADVSLPGSAPPLAAATAEDPR